jgi:hypothetical protein
LIAGPVGAVGGHRRVDGTALENHHQQQR